MLLKQTQRRSIVLDSNKTMDTEDRNGTVAFTIDFLILQESGYSGNCYLIGSNVTYDKRFLARTVLP